MPARPSPNPVLAIPKDRHGEILNVNPLAEDDPRAPLRGGDPYFDAEDGITYVVFPKLNHLDGWAPLDFWRIRWAMSEPALFRMVSRGFLDAGIDARARVKRFRCRDERLVKESTFWAEERKRLSVQMSKKRSVELIKGKR
jgi:hypothetical protein